MEFKNSHNRSFLFLFLLLVYCRLFTEGSPEKWESTICQKNHTLDSNILLLKCTVNITFKSYSEAEIAKKPYRRPPTCQKSELDSLLILTSRSESIMNVLCVSSRPIYLKIEFEHGVPKEEFLKMQWRRRVPDFYNHTSYNYEMFLILPVTVKESAAIKYTMFTGDSPEKMIHILWFDSIILVSSKLGDKLNNGVIMATDETIDIPCVFRQPETAALSRTDGSQIVGTEIPIDNASLSYSQAYGFKINTTEYTEWQGKYYCKDKEYFGETETFEIKQQPNFTYAGEFQHLATNVPNLRTPFYFTTTQIGNITTIYDFHRSQFDLTCKSVIPTVTLQAEPMEDVIYSKVEKPLQLFAAKIFNVSIGEYTEESNVNCLDSSSGQVFHEWRLKKVPTTYSRKNVIQFNATLNQFKCSAISYPFDPYEVELRQIKCNDRFSCRELAPALFLPVVATKVYIGSDCYPQHWQDYEICKSLAVLPKGYFKCTWSSRSLKMRNATYQDIYFVGFDDKLYIGNVDDPSDEAILKVRLLNETPEKILPLPGIFIFSCEAHSFYFENGIQWLFKFSNGTQRTQMENITDQVNIDNYSENVLKISEIYIDDISVQQIVCAAPRQSNLNKTNHLEWNYKAMNLTLEYSIPPIIKIEDSNVKYFRVGEADQVLKCQAEGYPRPEITWGIAGNKTLELFSVTGGFNYKLLQFPAYNKSLAGEYVCTAKNKAGIQKQIFTVHTFENESDTSVLSTWAIVGIVLFLIVITTVLSVAGFIIRRFRLQIKDLLSDADITEFKEGIAPLAEDDKNCPLSLPYNEKYEIDKEQFEIGEFSRFLAAFIVKMDSREWVTQESSLYFSIFDKNPRWHPDKKKLLGKGAFGIVYSGTVSNEYYTGSVAIKTNRPNCTKEQFKSLLSELKIMMHVGGEHENVIRLIAAYTKDIKNGTIYIAIELCSSGSLEHYLRAENDKITENLMETFPKKKLCNWASQIADGMEYLGFKYIVHSDLAARNILLDSNEIAKITDFGLSRRMYNYFNYEKNRESNDPLPWKWMALESLRTLTFSTQSDVWAYGITLWEIFSLGAVPYPGISWTPEFREMLENGSRNPKPKLADAKIYNVMMSCWNKDPSERPTFNCLKSFFMQLTAESQVNNEVHEDSEAYRVIEDPTYFVYLAV